MTARRTIVGLCALCALLVSAVAAQGASAAAENTAVECTTTGTQISGTEKFSDAHCKTPNGTTGPFYHVATPNGVKVASTLTNITTGEAREPAFLEAVVGGLNTIISAKKVSASGTIENNVAGEMYAEGLAGSPKVGETKLVPGITFEEVEVTNRECEIFGITPETGVKTKGIVKSQPVKGKTTSETQVIKFEPQTGNLFAEFELTGVKCPEALKGLYPVFGTFLSQKTEGATTPVSTTAVTAAKTLRVKNATTGPVAGLGGKITIKKTSGGVPIALT